MKTLGVRFQISAEMVKDFAELTGDYNSLHMDEEFARKSKYRQRIVHGMLPFSFIALLQNDFPNNQIEFLSFDTNFRRPIFVGDEIKLEITYSNSKNENYEYQALWYRFGTQDILIKSRGNFSLINLSHLPEALSHNKNCFVLDELFENTYTIQDIVDKKGEFNLLIDTVLTRRYKDYIFMSGLLHPSDDIYMCKNLAATLLLSSLVGMKLPGRYATFAKFIFSFQENINTEDFYKLSGEVNKVSAKSESLEIVTTLANNNKVIANGKLSVTVNTPPRQTISCEEIRSNYLDMNLKDKVIIITGASRGIGAATAKLFAMHEAKVVINYYRGKQDAELIVKEIEQFGGNAIALQCDIRDEIQVVDLISDVVEKFGTINILVNNAVKEFIPKKLLQIGWNDYLSELEVSLKGMHNLCKQVIPIFQEQRGGKIINLSTTTVDNPVTGQNQYITAKSAVVGYTKSLARELAGSNIQVNLVTPNMTDTDLIACIPSEFAKKIASERAFGRNLQPIEVAQSILFLASSWSNSITGQKVVLNLGELPFG
ncbi:MAG: SDR family oxidoreductase [Calothrix sp. MO_167.B12]|nr:SDR family oxidoreductase [Calothrix sp. MO_167.B12]